MRKVELIAGIILLSQLLLSAAIAAPIFDPTGVWSAPDKVTRYTVSKCGDGTELCAVLSWIKPENIVDENRHLIGKALFERMKTNGVNKWKGTLSFDGKRVGGFVEMKSHKDLLAKGCILFWCQQITLVRLR